MIPGFEPSGRRSFRTMHAATIERLAELGAKVIAFDLYFKDEDARYDEHFAQAIEASE